MYNNLAMSTATKSILIIAAIAAITYGIFFFSKKKKKADQPPPTSGPPTPVPISTGSGAGQLDRTKVLTNGVRGPEVSALQSGINSALNTARQSWAAGDPPVPDNLIVDGWFGPKTLDALRYTTSDPVITQITLEQWDLTTSSGTGGFISWLMGLSG